MPTLFDDIDTLILVSPAQNGLCGVFTHGLENSSL